MESLVAIDGRSLTLDQVVAVARNGADVQLDGQARKAMVASREWVERAAAGQVVDDAGEPLPVYGVNTGYGSLARVRIHPDDMSRLSWNLIRSHAAGVGPSLPTDVVRAMMLLRANALARGASGCAPELVETLLAMLEAGVAPVVPSRGSCGSSGDLAPLAHLGVVVFKGDDDDGWSGQATFGGETLEGREAMARAGVTQLVPGPKDGLAITNGAQLCTALGALTCWDASRLVLHAEIAAAMTYEALCGVSGALHPSVHLMRPYPGAIACAANLRLLLEGSDWIDSLWPDKVQDAYSLRCTPQVLGAVRDGIRYATDQIQVELNAVTDNPVILLDAQDGPNKAYSAGLFHGEPVGMACDHLKLALCELAALAERRIYRLTTGTLSARLPPLLIREDQPGMGLMMPHVTAAALVSDNRALAWPCSADSIPTCEDQEDLVAMATAAARRASEVAINSRRVVAIELLSAARGLRWRREHDATRALAPATAAALDVIEATLPDDPAPSAAMEAIDTLLQSTTLLDAVQGLVGPLEAL